MKSASAMKSLVAVTLALALSMVMIASLAWAVNPHPGFVPPNSSSANLNPGVLPPNSHPFGKTYGEWGAAWWQWETLATLAENPVLDTTGEYASLHQSGPVFFLAGTFGPPPVVRNVTISAGKALFIPISNWVLTYPEDVPSNISKEDAEAWMRETLNSVFNGIPDTDLIVRVDGVAVENPTKYRAQSSAFSMYFPPDCASVTSWSSLQGVPYQAGKHFPNISDGYWVMLAPLSIGHHKIEIKYPEDGSYVNVTYNLTVHGGH
jgi:hypothetical protein